MFDAVEATARNTVSREPINSRGLMDLLMMPANIIQRLAIRPILYINCYRFRLSNL